MTNKDIIETTLRELNIKDINISLNLENNSTSTEEVEEEYKNLLLRLKEYIDNGHKNTANTNFVLDDII